jgi:UDP-N-acetylmuramyl pentapeptide phosphotransferase/UDP-N-acetylglucosamine-1-phosphate transferase
MNYLTLLVCLALAVLQGFILIPRILVIANKRKLYDMPDKRKIHSQPIPRLGGVSFFPIVLISVSLVYGLWLLIEEPDTTVTGTEVADSLFLICGVMALYLTGLADDLVGVGYKQKFVIQFIAAVLLVASGKWINNLNGFLGIWCIPDYLGIPLTIFIIIYITNAINLIDGVDGLASGLCAIALFFLTIFLKETEQFLTLVSVATFGAIVPFWIYNVFGNAKRGHKLFMGDTGSLTLGYAISIMVIYLSYGPQESRTMNPYMVMAFSTLIVPLFDVVRVVLVRLRSGHNPFLPDKNHIHHKLLRCGMRVRYVMLTILAMALFFIALNFVLCGGFNHWHGINLTWIVAIDVVIWTAMHMVMDYYIKRYSAKRAMYRREIASKAESIRVFSQD